MIYPGDIDLCTETPKKGGLNLSNVKKIAEKNFNINIENKNKEELCNLINDKLIKLKIKKIEKHNDDEEEEEEEKEDFDDEDEEEEELDEED